MAQSGWSVLLLAALLPAGAAVEIVSTPPGAAVRWSRADSPLMHAAGTTPCRADLPDGAGVVVEFTAPGYLPAFRPLPRGGARLGVGLKAWSPALAEQLAHAPGPNVPSADPGVRSRDHWLPDPPRRREPAADGGGMYIARSVAMRRGNTSGDGTELWWLPFGGPALQLHSTFGHGDGRSIWPELASSPDGRWLAWSDCDDDGYLIAVRPRGGGAMRVLHRDARRMTDYPSWSPDGRWVYYLVAPPAERREHPSYQLHRVDWETQLDERVADGLDEGPACADSGSVAYVATDHTLREFDLATRQMRVLADRIGVPDSQWPLRRSPDGRWFAVQRSDSPQVAVIARDGSSRRDVGDGRDGFTWLPDSSGLLLGRRVVSREGRLLEELQPMLGPIRSARWLPDSRRLVAVCELEGHSRALNVEAGPGMEEVRAPNRGPLGETGVWWVGGWQEITASRVGEVWEAVPAGESLLLLTGEAGRWRLEGSGQVRRRPGNTWTATKVGPPLPSARSLTAAGGFAWLVTGLSPARLVRLDLATGAVIDVPGAPPDVEQVEVSPDGRWLALLRRWGKAGLLPSGGGRLVEFTMTPDSPAALRWKRDSTEFTAGTERAVRCGIDGLCCQGTGVIQVFPEVPGDDMYARGSGERKPATLSPDGERLAVIGEGALWVSDIDTPDRLFCEVNPAETMPGPFLFAARRLGGMW